MEASDAPRAALSSRASSARVGDIFAAILFFATFLGMWGAIWAKGADDRMRAEQAARMNAQTLARVLEDQFHHVQAAIDHTLFSLREAYIRAPEGFDLSAWQRGGALLPESALQLSLVDREGYLVVSSLSPGARINLIDRDHIRFHFESHDDRLFISRPVLGRISKKWSIQFTRRITGRDGSIAGVAIVSVDVAALARFYSGITIGRSGMIVLAGEDGFIRLVVPDSQGRGNNDLGKEPLWPVLVRDNRDAVIGTLAGIEHEQFFVTRRIAGTGLMLIIGQAMQEIHAGAVQSMRWMVMAGTLGSAWLFGCLAVFHMSRRRHARLQQTAEAGARAQREFLAMMGHEVRTLLNGIIGYADLLAAGDLTGDQRQMVVSQKQSALQLLQLMNDVLDVSKRDSDAVRIDSVPFAIDDVVTSTLDVLRGEATRKGLALESEIAPDLPASFKGDPARIRQILFNLVGNGIKFTEKGHVRVQVSGARTGAENGFRLDIRVSDTGCGIEPGLRDKVLQAFSQGEGGTNRRFAGAGLGLAICRRLAHQMGGEIEIQSEPGQGTHVTARLRVMENGSAARLPAWAAMEGLPALRILLVEDNPTNQLVISRMLGQLGQEVVVAADGRQGLAAVQASRFDLVLMDVMMPVMDGLAATRAIRALPGEVSRVPIWALTANSLESDEAACREAGMDKFATKPITRDRLEAMLRRYEAGQSTDQRSIAVPQLPESRQRSAIGPLRQAGQPRLSPQAAAELIAGNGQLFTAAAYQSLINDLGEEGARDILGTFISEAEGYLDALADSLVAENRQILKRIAHSLKGSALTVGFGAISDIARQIEAWAQDEALCELGKRIDRLAEEFGAIRDCLPPSLAEKIRLDPCD